MAGVATSTLIRSKTAVILPAQPLHGKKQTSKVQEVSFQQDITVVYGSGMIATNPITIIGYSGNTMVLEAKPVVSAVEPRYITSLPSSGVVLKRPLTAFTIRNGPDDFTAYFTEAEIAAAGESPDDAIEGLSEAIVDVFEAYSENEALGPDARAQLATLKGYIDRRNAAHLTERSGDNRT